MWAWNTSQHALNRGEVPLEVVADERRIQEARARESGKPAEIVAKMVEGAVNKFLGEKTLLGQPFVKDDSRSVGDLLKANGLSLVRFLRYKIGDVN